MYFDNSEFLCSCGCGRDVTDELKVQLDAARHVAGVAFPLTSGARCPEYNKSISASPTSSHTKGLAVDIAFNSSRAKFKIINALMLMGFRRIGINSSLGFIHVDMDEDKPQDVLFSY